MCPVLSNNIHQTHLLILSRTLTHSLLLPRAANHAMIRHPNISKAQSNARPEHCNISTEFPIEFHRQIYLQFTFSSPCECWFSSRKGVRYFSKCVWFSILYLKFKIVICFLWTFLITYSKRRWGKSFWVVQFEYRALSCVDKCSWMFYQQT